MAIAKHSNQQCLSSVLPVFPLNYFFGEVWKTGEMAPLLTALNALAEELKSVSSIPVELELQVVRHHALFWTLRATLCTHRESHNRHNKIKIILNLFFTHSLEISYM